MQTYHFVSHTKGRVEVVYGTVLRGILGTRRKKQTVHREN
jgi:hypothetical protein